MTKLPDDQYNELLQRIANGKQHIYAEGCCPTAYERKECIDTYMDLSSMALKQAALRGLFDSKKTEAQPWRIAGETPDDYVERKRAELIEKGVFTSASSKTWLRGYKRRKGGAVPKNVPSRSESYSLF